jgi:hypothetical protein
MSQCTLLMKVTIWNSTNKVSLINLLIKTLLIIITVEHKQSLLKKFLINTEIQIVQRTLRIMILLERLIQ